MRIKSFIFSIFCCFCLTACVPDLFYKREVVTPPDYLVMNVNVEKPPLPNEYLKLSPRDKEKVLFNLYKTQTTYLGAANIQFNSTRQWGLQQKALELNAQ